MKTSLRQLRISYIATASVVLFLLITTQLIIQLTLRQEVQTRTLGNKIAVQALYTQGVLKNALELVITPGNTLWSQKLQTDIDSLLPTEQQLLSHDLPANEREKLQSQEPSFQQLIAASQKIIQETKTYDKNNRAQLRDQYQQTLTVFRTESLYLPQLVAIFNDLSSQADMFVTQVQIAEICLFLLSIGTVLAEFLLVARPAVESIQEIVKGLQKTLNEFEIHKEKTTNP